MSDYKPDIHKELFVVSQAGDCSRVRELLEAGADPDKYKDSDGWTALHCTGLVLLVTMNW